MKLTRRDNNTVGLLVLCVALIMGLFVCCGKFVDYVHNKEKTLVTDYMLDTTEKSAIAINDRINGYMSSLRAVSAALTSKPGDNEFGRDIMRHELELGDFRRIGYVYRDGSTFIVDATLGELTGVDFRGRDYFKASIAGKEYVTNPFNDYWTQTSIIILSVPIYANNQVIGVLCGVNDAKTFTASLQQSYSDQVASFRIVNSVGQMC